MAEKADRLFEQALEHHREGRLAEAGALYQRILRARPRDHDAWYLLGVVAHQSGEPERAVERMRRSLAIAPEQARCHTILGLDLMTLGRAKEAEASLRRAAELENSAESYNNLAGLLMAEGRMDEAIGAYQKALELEPGHTAVHCNMANAWRAKGDLARAAECFLRAVESDPEHAPALAALGQTLLKLDRAAEAAPYLQRAAALAPEDAEVHCELGDALQAQRQLAPSLDAYRRSLALDPKLARAWYSAGCAESARQEFTSAVACFQRALEIAPSWPEAQHNLGRALFKLGQVEAAMDLFRRAAATGDPALPLAALALVIPGDPSSDNQAVLDTRRKWAESQFPATAATVRRSGGGRWRLGYVSSFFANRNWMKPVWGLINQHDRQLFEIHLYSDAPVQKIQHGYLPHPEDRFHDVTALTNSDLAQLIEESQIDLLIDLNGYSAMERLPMIALRPAPVIAGWFNMYATTGMASYDYLIGDKQVIPPEEEPFYCEKIVRVPGSYLTFEVTYPVPPVADPPCLAKGAITFGSLAPLYKITNGAIGVWSKILHKVPGSTMLIKNRELGSPGARCFVEGLFARHGITPERLRLEGPSEHYQFLATYTAIDIALDTFPYNGGTTTTEAIWQGVPVVTFHGDRWVSRTSATILHAGGLAELVGQGIAGYEELAIRLANAPDRLLDLRRNMRAQLSQSPVCDTHTFARNMERIYSAMLAGEIPAPS